MPSSTTPEIPGIANRRGSASRWQVDGTTVATTCPAAARPPARLPSLRSISPTATPGPGSAGLLRPPLPPLPTLPRRGGFPAVDLQKRTSGAGARGVDAVGIGLRGVMFPQLRPSVRVAGKVRLETQRRALGGNRQRRT